MLTRFKHFFFNLDAKKRLVFIILAVVGVWMLTGIFHFGSDAVQSAIHQKKTALVEKIPAEPYTRKVSLIGHTEGNQMVTISAELPAQVEWLAPLGNSVQAGDVVVKLEKNETEEALAAALADVKAAETLYNAAKRLSSEGYKSTATLAEREAALANAQRSLAQARLNIGRTEIKSPVDGTIEEHHIDVGDYVKDGGALVDILGRNKRLVVGFVSQKDQPNLIPGKRVDVFLPDGDMVEGTLSFVAKQGDPFTRTFRVEVEVNTENQTIPAGMSARMEIPTHETTAHAIPHSALVLSDGGELGVMVVEDSIARFKPITLVQDSPEQAVVTGLDGTAYLVVRGQAALVDGEEVKVKIKGQNE